MKLNSRKHKPVRGLFLCFTLGILSMIPVWGKEKNMSNQAMAATPSVEDSVKLLRSGSLAEKTSAMGVLRYKGKDAVPALIVALGDRDSDVRGRAARILGEIKDTQCIPHLGRLVVADTDLLTRQYAILALARIKDRAGSEFLEKSVREDSSFENRGVAAITYAMIDGSSSIKTLKDVLGKTDDKMLKVKISRALGIAGDDSGYPIALGEMEDSDWKIREEAAYALGFIGKSDALPTLNKHLNDPYRGVQFKSLEAIKRVEYKSKPYPENFEMLKTSLDDPSGTVRNWAAQELVEMGRPEANNLLKVKAHSGHVEARNILSWKGIQFDPAPTEE